MGNLVVKEVNFNGDNLIAVKDESTGKIFTGVSYICKGIGMSKGQKDRQTENAQYDLVLKKGCRKFEAGVLDPHNEVIGIEIDFLPLWLAKIAITPRTQKEKPELAGKLVQYQLKAKDVLANAFLNPYKGLSKELQAIFAIDKKTNQIENRVNDLEDNMPLFNVECKELQSLVRKVATKILGGYKSSAYCNNSLRGRVYSDIQRELRRQFGVKRYEAIKRKQLESAKRILEEYAVPLILENQIEAINNQIAISEIACTK